MSILDELASRFGSWLPNSNFTIPFELVTVYNAVNVIWDSLPLAVRACLIGSFMIGVLLCILKMLL